MDCRIEVATSGIYLCRNARHDGAGMVRDTAVLAREAAAVRRGACHDYRVAKPRWCLEALARKTRCFTLLATIRRRAAPDPTVILLAIIAVLVVIAIILGEWLVAAA